MCRSLGFFILFIVISIFFVSILSVVFILFNFQHLDQRNTGETSLFLFVSAISLRLAHAVVFSMQPQKPKHKIKTKPIISTVSLSRNSSQFWMDGETSKLQFHFLSLQILAEETFFVRWLRAVAVNGNNPHIVVYWLKKRRSICMWFDL